MKYWLLMKIQLLMIWNIECQFYKKSMCYAVSRVVLKNSYDFFVCQKMFWTFQMLNEVFFFISYFLLLLIE